MTVSVVVQCPDTANFVVVTRCVNNKTDRVENEHYTKPGERSTIHFWEDNHLVIREVPIEKFG